MPAIVPPFQTPHSITQPCARTVEESRRLAMYSSRPSIVRPRYFEYTRSNWSVCWRGSRRRSSPNNLKGADPSQRTADLAIVCIRLGHDCTIERNGLRIIQLSPIDPLLDSDCTSAICDVLSLKPKEPDSHFGTSNKEQLDLPYEMPLCLPSLGGLGFHFPFSHCIRLSESYSSSCIYTAR